MKILDRTAGGALEHASQSPELLLLLRLLQQLLPVVPALYLDSVGCGPGKGLVDS